VLIAGRCTANVVVLLVALLSTPEAVSAARMPRREASDQSLRLSRDQDGGKRPANSTPLSTHIAVTSRPGTADLMTSSVVRLSTAVAGLEAHRRRRTAFTSDQLLELEKEFHSKKYLSLTERSQLAHDLQLSEVPVYTVCSKKHNVIDSGCKYTLCSIVAGF